MFNGVMNYAEYALSAAAALCDSAICDAMDDG